MHHMSNVNFDTLKDGPERKKSSPEKLYAQSKFVRHLLIWFYEDSHRCNPSYWDRGILWFQQSLRVVMVDKG